MQKVKNYIKYQRVVSLLAYCQIKRMNGEDLLKHSEKRLKRLQRAYSKRSMVSLDYFFFRT